MIAGRGELSDIPSELRAGAATPEEVCKLVLHVARRTGSYRQGAAAAEEALDSLCENNAAKLCALAYLIGVITAGVEEPRLRDLLRLAVPLIARELTTGG